MCYCVEAYLNCKRNVSWWMDGGATMREMSWNKVQGYLRYIIQYLYKTDFEQIIVNSSWEMCTIKMVVHYAVMLQPPVEVYRWQTCQM